ncbi:hypothetical protein C1N57_13615 [Priestia aryabhattai]
MLAEIYNKISQTSSNLSDSLEYKLTGNFFVTIPYYSLFPLCHSYFSQRKALYMYCKEPLASYV